ncbi:MAG: helix-turn-helix domain-containing protein, partial [Pseudomonadota bacterium]
MGSFLTIPEAAVALGVTRRMVQEAVARGVLPVRRDNELNWRVDVTDGQNAPRHRLLHHPAG